jgi:uncharacterized protein YbjT (DUF2867 family)
MGDRERVLVVGGTGRTGVKLVDKLRTDPSLTVCVLARDREKADMLFASDDEVEIIEGDLTNTAEWEDSLDGVSQVVTAVSCGLRTDPLVVLGLREAPGRLPARCQAAGGCDNGVGRDALVTCSHVSQRRMLRECQVEV